MRRKDRRGPGITNCEGGGAVAASAAARDGIQVEGSAGLSPANKEQPRKENDNRIEQETEGFTAGTPSRTWHEYNSPGLGAEGRAANAPLYLPRIWPRRDPSQSQISTQHKILQKRNQSK